jgi:hypothetical protein
MSFAGHYWSIAPSLRHRLFPRPAPPATKWNVEFTTRHGGQRVRLGGRWREEDGADVALLVVHGLAGSFDRQYCVAMAQAAARRGWSCLRVALRGADREGSDFYHAGLVEDLEAALSHECLRHYRTIHVVGFSLGGHVSLRFAAQGRKERMGCVAAVCPPLDLDYCATHLDERTPRIYRKHLLEGLNEIYASVAARTAVPTPVARMKKVKGIREWDSLSVVPRFGFADALDYYRTESAGRYLVNIDGPALIVAAEHDPMVPIDHIRAASTRSPENIRWIFSRRGGHVGFPPRMSFGQPGDRGWSAQLCELIEAHANS